MTVVNENERGTNQTAVRRIVPTTAIATEGNRSMSHMSTGIAVTRDMASV
jgi:hypothetical protein